MGKKDKDFTVEDYEKLKNDIIREKVNGIFRRHPKADIRELEEIGFKYFDDDFEVEETEERNAKPENQRQTDLVAFFENRKKLSENIFEYYLAEKDEENPNYPLIRRYFKKANKNLKDLLLYGLKNNPARIDLLSDLTFFHEFENILAILIANYTQACVEQDTLETFLVLAEDFYYATKPDGYEAYHALKELFGPDTEKRKLIEFLMTEKEAMEKQSSNIIEF